MTNVRSLRALGSAAAISFGAGMSEATRGSPATSRQKFIASDWRKVSRNSLQGFFSLTLPSGVTLRECSLHERNGKRWVGLPARPQTNKDGSRRIDPKTGKSAWSPLVEIRDRAIRERFQTAALAAVDRLLASEGSRENAGVAPREIRDRSAP